MVTKQHPYDPQCGCDECDETRAEIQQRAIARADLMGKAPDINPTYSETNEGQGDEW